jgi:PAS domain S-box-containing protein
MEFTKCCTEVQPHPRLSVTQPRAAYRNPCRKFHADRQSNADHCPNRGSLAIADRRSSTISEELSEYRKIFDVAVDGLIISDRGSGLVVEANPAACRMLGYTREEMLGLELSNLIHPESKHQYNEEVRLFRDGEEIDIWIRDMRKDGVSAYSRWRAGALEYRGYSCMLWSVRDMSERMQAEMTLRQRMITRRREQSALLDISRTLSSSLEFPPGLVLEQLRELIPYDRAAIFGLEGSAFVSLAMRGTADLDLSGTVRIDTEGPETLHRLFNSRRPIRIADISSASRNATFLRALLEHHTDALFVGMRSWMWVPLTVRTGILGGLGVAHQKKGFFTAHHAELALNVANQAVIMMVNAELYRNAQSTAASHERQRLAQSLHDAVNQSLFSAGLIAEVLPRVWDQDQALARQSLEDMRRLLRGAGAEMRALLAELRPGTLTEAELGELIRQLADAFTGRTNIPVTLVVTGGGSLPADVQVAVYRICQEAFNNIARHSGACGVQISLHQDGAAIDLQIRDDGRGFDPKKRVPGHFGLGMMHERAQAVGARLSIRSQPRNGTELLIHWPAAAA